MADYVEYGEHPTSVSVSSQIAGVQEQLNKTSGGRSPIIDKRLTFSDATVAVNEHGRNTQPVEATIQLKKLKIAPEDQGPKVKSGVDNNRLAKMLEASGYGAQADDLRATAQMQQLNNANLLQADGKTLGGTALASRMNYHHRFAKGVFGLKSDQELTAINGMKQPQINAMVRKAQEANPDLQGANLDNTAKNGLPVAVNELNAKKREEELEASKNPENVQTIKIGMVGLNFKHDRKHSIEKSPEFVPEHKKQDDALDAAMASWKKNQENAPYHGDYARQMGRDRHPPSVVAAGGGFAGPQDAPAPSHGKAANGLDADGKPAPVTVSLAALRPPEEGLFGAVAGSFNTLVDSAPKSAKNPPTLDMKGTKTPPKQTFNPIPTPFGTSYGGSGFA